MPHFSAYIFQHFFIVPLFAAVAPFPGATTGTGGRIRDVQAAGRGAHVVAGTAGYCFGNLKIPGFALSNYFAFLVKIDLKQDSPPA